jgi:parallel beta-helix repeat protein
MKFLGTDLAEGIKQLRAGDVLELLNGRTYAGGSFFDLKGITIRGNGATIAGGLRLSNCGAVDVSDLFCCDAKRKDRPNGFKADLCASLRLARLTASRNVSNGILTANTSHVDIRNCVANHNLDGHGIYLSQSGDDLTLIGNTCKRNARAGIQINADEEDRKPGDPLHDSLSVGVLVQGNNLWGNQTRYGAAALTLACIRKARVLANQIDEHMGRHGIVLWDDGTGLACEDVEIDGVRFTFAPNSKHPAQACIRIEKGCRRVKIGAGNIYPAGVPQVSAAEGTGAWAV